MDICLVSRKSRDLFIIHRGHHDSKLALASHICEPLEKNCKEMKISHFEAIKTQKLFDPPKITKILKILILIISTSRLSL